MSGVIVSGMNGVQFIHTGKFLSKLQKRVKIAGPWHHVASVIRNNTKQENVDIFEQSSG